MSYEAREYLAGLPVEPSFEIGARNAVLRCLGVRPREHVVLVAEGSEASVAAALLREALAVGADVLTYLVTREQIDNEQFVIRLMSRLSEADASILVCSIVGLPAAFRRRVSVVPGERRRHIELVGVTPAMMEQSMRADYREVDAFGERLAALFRPGSVIEITTAVGTDLTIRCDPSCRWVNDSGLRHKPGSSSLPGGELFTTPATVDGRFTADAGIWMPGGRELMRSSRMVFHFNGGELSGLEGGSTDRRLLLDVLDAAPHGRRVGQVGFGTNGSVLTPIGAMLQDLKMPGFHLALGDTRRERTGAKWSSDVAVQLLSRRPDVWVDGTPVMVRGRFARSLA